MITDGDVPCTTEVEQNFTWAFNVCGDVTLPPASCSDSAPAAMYQVTVGVTWCLDYNGQGESVLWA